MKNKLIAALAVTVAMFAAITPANAALQTIGTATYNGGDYKLIYDVEDQLTWLDYSNSGATRSGSYTWATGLNGPGVLTINLDEGYTALWDSSEWRLAGNATGWWSGGQYAIYGSEINDLYYDELGNELNDTSLNYGDFDHLLASMYHISAVPTFDVQLGLSWSTTYDFSDGTHAIGSSSWNSGVYGMAVIDGAVVPEPATLSLLALGGLALLRKRK